MGKWFKIRLAFIGVSFICGFLQFLSKEQVFLKDSPPIICWLFGGIVIFTLCAVPFIAAGVISMQAINPFSDRTWKRPLHDSNPFNFRNPLLFIHFGSFVIMAGGLGKTVSSVMSGLPQFLAGIGMMLGGLGCLAGVYLSMRWCKSKMEPDVVETLN